MHHYGISIERRPKLRVINQWIISFRPRTGSIGAEPPLTKQEIDRKPWKYIGYRGYSNFIASDCDFYVLQRFASLNTHVALALQDQVSILEAELDELDTAYSPRDAEDLHNGSTRMDRADRIKLVNRIADNIMKYSTFKYVTALFAFTKFV